MTAFEMEHFDFSDEAIHATTVERADGSIRRARLQLVAKAMPAAIESAEDVADLKVVVRHLFGLFTERA